MGTRLSSIQVLRAIAALLVLVAHQGPVIGAFGEAPDAVPDLSFGTFGVDLFFVISGFIMVHTAGKLFGQPGAAVQFLSRRLLRIVPLYWALTAALIAGPLIKYGALPKETSLQHLLASFLFFPTLSPQGTPEPVFTVGWTLNYEMLFYVLFALALFLRRDLALISLTAVLFILPLVPFSSLPFSFWSDSIIFEFAFGMWIGWLYSRGMRLSGLIGILIAAAGMIVAIYANQAGLNLTPRIAWWGIPAALIIAGIALSDLEVPFFLFPLVALGDASYALYLVHWLTPIGIRISGIINVVSHGAACTISIAISITAAFALNELDKRFRSFIKKPPTVARERLQV
jgi:exopolysaccharide production protein ExoZ